MATTNGCLPKETNTGVPRQVRGWSCIDMVYHMRATFPFRPVPVGTGEKGMWLAYDIPYRCTTNLAPGVAPLYWSPSAGSHWWSPSDDSAPSCVGALSLIHISE